MFALTTQCEAIQPNYQIETLISLFICGKVWMVPQQTLIQTSLTYIHKRAHNELQTLCSEASSATQHHFTILRVFYIWKQIHFSDHLFLCCRILNSDDTNQLTSQNNTEFITSIDNTYWCLCCWFHPINDVTSIMMMAFVS